MKIVSLDEGLTQFDPYDFQEKLINNFHNNRFNICKMPRQTGKSTTVVSYLLHYAVFNDSVNIGILRQNRLQENFLEDYKLHTRTYQNGCSRVLYHGTKDRWIWKMGAKYWLLLRLRVLSEVCHFNILFLDEFAFVPNHIADSFFASVYPTITSGQSTKVIIVSTPHGMNHFYRMA